MDVQRRREELEATIRSAEAQMRNLAIVPIEDVFPNGAMFRLRVRPIGGDELTYLLLKIVDNEIENGERRGWWHHTGRRNLVPGRTWGNAAMRWPGLMTWLLSSAHMVLEWTELTEVKGDDAAPTPAKKDL